MEQEYAVEEVQVALFTPNNGNAQYVYGVFPSEDLAQEHWKKHGDKDGTLRVTREHLIRRK